MVELLGAGYKIAKVLLSDCPTSFRAKSFREDSGTLTLALMVRRECLRRSSRRVEPGCQVRGDSGKSLV